MPHWWVHMGQAGDMPRGEQGLAHGVWCVRLTMAVLWSARIAECSVPSMNPAPWIQCWLMFGARACDCILGVALCMCTLLLVHSLYKYPKGLLQAHTMRSCIAQDSVGWVAWVQKPPHRGRGPLSGPMEWLAAPAGKWWRAHGCGLTPVQQGRRKRWKKRWWAWQGRRHRASLRRAGPNNVLEGFNAAFRKAWRKVGSDGLRGVLSGKHISKYLRRLGCRGMHKSWCSDTCVRSRCPAIVLSDWFMLLGNV